MAPSLRLATQRSHGSGHGLVSTGVGWLTGVRFSTFRAHSPGHQQAEVVQGDLSDANRSFWPQKEWFPELRSLAVAPLSLRPTQTAPLSSPVPEPPHAEPSCVATIQRFTRHLDLS